MGGSGWARRQGASLSAAETEEGEEAAAEPFNNEALREVNKRLTPRGMIMKNERRSRERDLEVFIFHLISHPYKG